MIIRYAEKGEYEKLRGELENGVNINTQDRYERTVIYGAVSGGNYEIVEFLIGKGASLTSGKRTLLSPIVNANALLGKNLNKQSSIRIAELLIKSGVKIHQEDVEIAAGSDFVEMIELFINSGADITKGKEKSPLASAILNGSAKTAVLLLKNGANPNEYWNGSPLIVLACDAAFPALGSNPEIVKALIASGANINAREKDVLEDTALKKAEAAGNKEIIKILKDAGAK